MKLWHDGPTANKWTASMEPLLVIAVLCLSAGVAILSSALPFLYWKCFRLEWRLAEEVRELQKQIDTLDEALSHLMEGIRAPHE